MKLKNEEFLESCLAGQKIFLQNLQKYPLVRGVFSYLLVRIAVYNYPPAKFIRLLNIINRIKNNQKLNLISIIPGFFMTISFNSFLNQGTGFTKEHVLNTLSHQQKKVTVVALFIFVCLSVYYIFKYCYCETKPIKLHDQNNKARQQTVEKTNTKIQSGQNKGKIHKPHSTLITGDELTSGKLKALQAYQAAPTTCSLLYKTVIFKDIKSIGLSKGQKNLTSVVGLMSYLSELEIIDLRNEWCAQVVIDTFKECNQETSSQLVEWLSTENTFHVALLSDSLRVLMAKHAQQLPVNLYALEQLIKIYKEKRWHEEGSQKNRLSLSIHDPLIVSVMALLIQIEPNNDRISALVEWMMHQQGYKKSVFIQWVSVFQQKEKEFSKVTGSLYYPLLNKMIHHFKEKWGEKQLRLLDPKMVDYLLSKNPGL